MTPDDLIATSTPTGSRVKLRLSHFEDGELLVIGATDYAQNDGGAPSFSLTVHDVQPSDLRAIRTAISRHLRRIGGS